MAEKDEDDQVWQVGPVKFGNNLVKEGSPGPPERSCGDLEEIPQRSREVLPHRGRSVRLRWNKGNLNGLDLLRGGRDG